MDGWRFQQLLYGTVLVRPPDCICLHSRVLLRHHPASGSLPFPCWATSEDSTMKHDRNIFPILSSPLGPIHPPRIYILFGKGYTNRPPVPRSRPVIGAHRTSRPRGGWERRELVLDPDMDGTWQPGSGLNLRTGSNSFSQSQVGAVEAARPWWGSCHWGLHAILHHAMHPYFASEAI